jgi:hypothetical protein
VVVNFEIEIAVPEEVVDQPARWTNEVCQLNVHIEVD